MDESALKQIIDSQEAILRSLHSRLDMFTGMVVIGVVLEVLFVVWEYREEMKDFRRGIIHTPEKPDKRLFILGLVGAGFVALGVAGELWVAVLADRAETKIRAANETRVALLLQEAGSAKKSADDSAAAATRAKLDSATAIANSSRASAIAAGARTEADKFEEKIVSANLENERIKKQLADRTISDAEFDIMRVGLKQFRGQKFFVFWYQLNPESTAIANRIFSVLTMSGWEYASQSGILAGGVTGMIVRCHPKADISTRSAARTLLDELLKAGFTAVLKEDEASSPVDNTIGLTVGSKL